MNFISDFSEAIMSSVEDEEASPSSWQLPFKQIVSHRHFEKTVLVAVTANCILLAIEEEATQVHIIWFESHRCAYVCVLSTGYMN